MACRGRTPHCVPYGRGEASGMGCVGSRVMPFLDASPLQKQGLGRRVGAGHRVAYRMVGAGLCAERARSTHQQTCPYKNRDCVGTGRRGRRVGAEVGARQNPWDCVLESSASPLQKRGLRSARRGRARPCPVVIASPRRGRGNPCFENHQIASLVTA